MGPRSEERGDAEVGAKLALDSYASMGPRSEEPGDAQGG